jgi:predicted ATPase/DNA-binding SARP family transcriptional activator
LGNTDEVDVRPTRLQLRVLGPLEVTADGSAIDLGAPRQRALLALLALNANRVLPRERIIDDLWGEQAPRTARNALQVAVHGLRRALGSDTVSTQGDGYRLAVGEDELDLERFTRLLVRAEREEPQQAAATLREALDLHRGIALADVPNAPFVAAERERIEELRLLALERRIDADLARGAAAELISELEALAVAHPFHESFRRQLMLALYRSGRQADALEAYRSTRSELVDELGVEPSRALQELEAAMLRQDPALDIRPRAERARVSAIPTPPRPLIGRELEVAAVTALIRAPDVRHVTLTGPGGSGKTRLAVEAARELQEDFAGSLYLVDLSPLRDPALVESSVANTVGVSAEADVDLAERIAAALAGQDTLLVIDNFEHVLEAAPFVARLLAHGSQLHVLATSREPLRIAAEHEYQVPPLGLPSAGTTALEQVSRAAAVGLFVARAEAARDDFELTVENAEAVVDICSALDGLPLALELAAARVRLLSIFELRDRIENRLELLADGPRDLPDRQRTLRSTIDWSYELLDEGEQRLLARLAVFAGGWTLDAAESVCDAGISTLGSLVDKSLVRSQSDGTNGTRFSMLETVREYALARLTGLGELDRVRDRHASYYGDLAVRLQPILESQPAVEEAAREHDNVRVALAHTLEHRDGATALRLCAIARLWYAHGYLGEGSAWIEQALALEGGDPVIRARVLYYGAAIAWSSGDYERAVLYGQDGLRLARETGDVIAEMGALTALGLAYQGTGDLRKSREYYRRSLDRAREGAHDRVTAVALVNIADIEYLSGNHVDAEALAREGLEIHRRIGEIEGTGVALLVLASSLLDRGSEAEAEAMIVESLSCFRRVGYKDFLVSALVALARSRVAGDPAWAARLIGAARTLRAPLGPSQFVWEHDWADSTEAKVRDLVGDARADAELAAGASAPGDVVDVALAEASATDPAS